MGPLEHLPDVLKAHDEKITALTKQSEEQLAAKDEQLAASQANIDHLRARLVVSIEQQEHAIATLREQAGLPKNTEPHAEIQRLRLELRKLTDALSETGPDDPVVQRMRKAMMTALVTDRVSAERHAHYLLGLPADQIANTFNPYVLALFTDPRLRRALLETLVEQATVQF